MLEDPGLRRQSFNLKREHKLEGVLTWTAPPPLRFERKPLKSLRAFVALGGEVERKDIILK